MMSVSAPGQSYSRMVAFDNNIQIGGHYAYSGIDITIQPALLTDSSSLYYRKVYKISGFWKRDHKHKKDAQNTKAHPLFCDHKYATPSKQSTIAIWERNARVVLHPRGNDLSPSPQMPQHYPTKTQGYKIIKKVFYWSPFTSKVATIKSVLILFY